MSTEYSNSAIKRYKRGYSTASLTAIIGTVIQVLSVVVSFGYLIYFMGTVSQMSGMQTQLQGEQGSFGMPFFSMPSLIGALVFTAVGYGFATYLIGLLFAVLGRLLESVLDSSVVSSTFLSREDQVNLLSLRKNKMPVDRVAAPKPPTDGE